MLSFVSFYFLSQQKKRISCFAISGCYGFKSILKFINDTKKTLVTNELRYNTQILETDTEILKEIKRILENININKDNYDGKSSSSNDFSQIISNIDSFKIIDNF
jgi:hypothetical protein